MGAKVALTDAWIEERDHEIDLPLDTAGRSKPLAHATFTDLVHFLLRMEGPKKNARKGRRPKDAAAAAAAAAAGAGAGAARTWEDEAEELDPQPGDTITLGGVDAYYTKGSMKLDEVAEKLGLDIGELLSWNKPDLPGLHAKAYLLERTRVWLGPRPPTPEPASAPVSTAVSNAVSNATEQLVDPEAERKRRDEELLAAAQAAQNAGIAKGPRDGALLGDECVDEPMVLGRPLKGLRQKDIDPTEREAIMAEMFKRVRPFLERNIEKAAERARARVKEEEEENAERAKQEQIRAERLLRRTEGIPVHLLSATASDFRSTAKASSSAPAAPYGGEITDAQMAELELEILRTLRAAASGRAPGADAFVPAANVKVSMARRARPEIITASRTRWDHAELGDAHGFVLAVCALDRADKITLRRNEKHPEAVDLASLKLGPNAGDVAPDTEETEARAAALEKDADHGVLSARDVAVSCGDDLVGTLTPGGKRGDEQVRYVPKGGTEGKELVVPATEFERLGGRGSTRKWRQSLRFVGDDDEFKNLPVGKYLREIGASYRDAVVATKGEDGKISSIRR